MDTRLSCTLDSVGAGMPYRGGVGPCEPQEIQPSQVQGPASGLGQSSISAQAGNEWIQSSLEERDLGELVGEQLDVPQLHLQPIKPIKPATCWAASQV